MSRVGPAFGSTAAERAALARLYDVDLLDDPGDVDLYRALAARAAGPILELGVGTGRIAGPLAAAGHRVTGVDSDPAMLDRARLRADAVTLVEADARSVRLADAGSYRLAFLALNSIMVVGDRHDQAAVVATLAAHLAPGGIAVVDVWLPDADDLARFDGRVILDGPRRDPDTGRLVTKASSALHDAATGTVHLTAIYEEGEPGATAVRWLRTDTLRLVSGGELVGFAETAGLEVEVLAGGYDLAPLRPGDDRAVLVAVAPDRRRPAPVRSRRA